ncbi:MAG TPA: isoprenylcysteine carboxylmethyltransferase family protein [Rhodospirillales bacterium]|nr:isoprenylcysteine carboxylmethyltransferase family protein [Rhodospirillales bacterium]
MSMEKSEQGMPDGLPDHAEVVAYPVALFLGFLIPAIIADYLWPIWMADPMWRVVAFLVFAVPGGIFVLLTFPQFRKAGTTADPYGNVSAIIRTGPFGLSRNPIYVGMCLMHLGIAVGVGGLIAVLVLVPILLIMHYGVILREEDYLERKHGEEYLDYKANVRRWI